MEAERRVEHRLGGERRSECREHGGGDHTAEERHGPNVHRFRLRGKQRGRAGGSVLFEATLALSILVVLGLALMRLSLNVVTPRQWTLQQTITDAYMSFEKARAQRVPFDTLESEASPWPRFPDSAEEEVEVGRLPGGRPILATVIRTRLADPNNLPEDGGTGTALTNPAGMVGWRLQSVVRYEVGSREYTKSKTVYRSQ